LDRLLTLVVAAAAASTPLPSLAQTRSAAHVATPPRVAGQSPALTTIDRHVIVLRPPGTAPTQPAPARRKPLRLGTAAKTGDAPPVQVHAKAAWLDDQGLRLTPTRVAFKRRF